MANASRNEYHLASPQNDFFASDFGHRFAADSNDHRRKRVGLVFWILVYIQISKDQ